MKHFLDNKDGKKLALALDGGGMRGIITAQALTVLEDKFGKKLWERFQLFVGTSTGTIIAAMLAAGYTAKEILDRYIWLGKETFRRNCCSSSLWRFVCRYRYPNEPLLRVLKCVFKDMTLKSLVEERPVVLLAVTRDLCSNKPLFIKSYKKNFQDWPLWKVVAASCSAPTYLPVFEKRYIDGGISPFNNPCLLAVFEILNLKDFEPSKTILLSLGTGDFDSSLIGAHRYRPWRWIAPMLDIFFDDTSEQQTNTVRLLIKKSEIKLDFHRYNVRLGRDINLDDTSCVEELQAYGKELGRKILACEQVELDKPDTPTKSFSRRFRQS